MSIALNQNNNLLHGCAIKLHQGELVKCGVKDRFRRFFSKNYNNREIQKVAAFLQTKLEETTDQEKASYLALANSVVKINRSNKHLQIFDRVIARHRPEISFIHCENQIKFHKWLKIGFPAEIFLKHPEFCQFLESSLLQSQMKVTRDSVMEIDGEAALIVNGEWMKWSKIKEKFEIIVSKRYGETFVIKKDTFEVYTYLDNKKGLQPHHPYLSERTPISTLNAENYDYEKVLAKAQQFIRPGEENLSLEEQDRLKKQRPFILQLVTSHVKGPDTNLHNLIIKSKHPYLRLIIGQDNPEINTKKGEVYEVGFGWEKKMSIPFVTTKGQFRSPDVWEYMPCEQKVVTNIAISQEEAKALNAYTAKYHRMSVHIGNPIGFHLTRQNCSSYIRAAFRAMDIQIPTEISLVDLLIEITPNWIKQVGRFFKRMKNTVYEIPNKIASYLPPCLCKGVAKVKQVFKRAIQMLIGAVLAFCVSLVRLPLGAAKGDGGAAFVAPDAPPKKILPDAANLRRWYDLSSYRFNLPGILQRWQRAQASTVIYDKPLKLAIVP